MEAEVFVYLTFHVLLVTVRLSVRVRVRIRLGVHKAVMKLSLIFKIMKTGV